MERLDSFMARANANYYATHDPFADFTTAPEIAQMFGELLGAWAAVVWQQMGAPDPVLLVEAGPGRGTLMGDVRRAVARVAPAFRAACRVHFVENSPRLAAAQARVVPHAAWHSSLADIPAGPTIVLANEFLDALPIRQFERRGGAWFERHVRDGRFALVPSARQGEASDGAVAEENEAGVAWVRSLAARLASQGGAALILDYGRTAPGFGDSLQALRCGGRADPLADPGMADLTAHVDFPALAATAGAAGAACHGPVAQGIFLHALGLGVRTERLAAANPACAAQLREAADRLAAPARMGAIVSGAGDNAPRCTHSAGICRMNPECLADPMLATRHGFFTRRGGVSEGPYASLNASLSGGDDLARVTANRALVAEALGADALVGIKQVHGTAIVAVDTPWPAGMGPEADGLVTCRAGLAIGVITADCAPVLLCDRAHGVIGAVHAGWHGAASGVLEEAVAAMGRLGAHAEDIAAVIGPCIGADSYEVGPDLRDAVMLTVPNGTRFFREGRPPDRHLFDLAGYCVARLARAGVRAHALAVDTLGDEARFFSHRRRTLAGGGAIGHQISAIVL